MNAFTLAKEGTSLVVDIGVTSWATAIFSTLCPVIPTVPGKVLVGIGSAVVSGVVADAAVQKISNDFDAVENAMNDLKKAKEGATV